MKALYYASVGVALLDVDLDRQVVEYQYGHCWYQLRDRDGLGCVFLYAHENGRWRFIGDDVRMHIGEYRQPCRILSKRAGRGDPSTRHPLRAGGAE